MKLIHFLLLVISFVYSQSGHATNNLLNESNINRVFFKLTQAVGDNSRALPKIVIRPNKRFGASYRRSENTIFIDQAAIDICETFGVDAESALAFLMGHELTHYYQKHDWQEAGFATSFITAQATFQAHIHQESEADTYSAFIAHLAGYETIRIIPELLEKIYIGYELKSKDLTAYPSLAERKAVANKVCKTVQGLIDIYQAANYLFALGKYDEALASYEYLLQYVKFKELYNNVGLCALYAALPITQRNYPFIYPLTLDISFPLRAPSGITKEELLQKAIAAFAKATNYDASYFTSFLNLICAYDLANQSSEADGLLNNITNLASTKKQQQKLVLLEGILAFRKGNKLKAAQLFEQIQGNKAFPELVNIATSNLRIAQGEKIERTILPAYHPMVNSKIEGINLLFYEQPPTTAYLLKNTNLDKKTINCQVLPKSKVFIYTSNGLVTKLQLTKSNALKTTEQLGIGDHYETILNQYQPISKKIVPHQNGFFLVLPKKGLLFNFNPANQVIEWGIFID